VTLICVVRRRVLPNTFRVNPVATLFDSVSAISACLHHSAFKQLIAHPAAAIDPDRGGSRLWPSFSLGLVGVTAQNLRRPQTSRGLWPAPLSRLSFRLFGSRFIAETLIRNVSALFSSQHRGPGTTQLPAFETFHGHNSNSKANESFPSF
jgi:hypothetical protein